jgi:16S rRNA (cytosine967-C5)-methyltransferase
MAAASRDPGKGEAGRALAARAVDRVLSQGATLDEALATVGDTGLAGRDRAHVQALAFGALRWHHRHRLIIGELLDRPLRRQDQVIEALLSVALFEMLDPDRPDYAAVSAAVGATRLLERPRAAGMVNAALRRFQRESPAILTRVMASDEGRFSHPAWLVAALRRDWPEYWQQIVEANQCPPPLWLRVNTALTTVSDYAARLEAELGIASTRLEACPEALRLARPVPVPVLPGFAEGLVTVQDAASQLAAGFIAAAPGMRVLDACAAPGGKTTHLLERGRGGIDLTAVDVAPERLARVEQNLARLGQSARLIAGDARRPGDWWDGKPFDRILIDAPCSATGVIRRHPDIKFLRRPGDLEALVARQQELLHQLWPLLAPGGRLLYATCSLLWRENVAVIQGWLGAEPTARELPLVAAGLARLPGPGLAVLPGPADTDGFYYALMERVAG